MQQPWRGSLPNPNSRASSVSFGREPRRFFQYIVQIVFYINNNFWYAGAMARVALRLQLDVQTRSTLDKFVHSSASPSHPD
jgi:hypothetical protein